MDFGDVPAWGAAIVALGSMVVAIVAAVLSSRQVAAAKAQADEAKKAREAAEAQVEVALRAAAAAERSAHADETSARLALQKAHEEKAPTFEFKGVGPAVPPCVQVKIRMEKGQPLSRATVRAVGRGGQLINGFSFEPDGSPQKALDLGSMHEGEECTVTVHCEQVTELTHAPVELECVATEKGMEPWVVPGRVRLRAPMHGPVAGPSPYLRTPESRIPRHQGVFRDRKPFLE